MCSFHRVRFSERNGKIGYEKGAALQRSRAFRGCEEFFIVLAKFSETSVKPQNCSLLVEFVSTDSLQGGKIKGPFFELENIRKYWRIFNFHQRKS